MTLTVYSACDGAVLGCHAGSPSGSSGPAWICGLPVQQGQTYRIRVASFGQDAATGGYTMLNISAPVAVLPVNISCESPLQVVNGNTSFDNSGSCGSDFGYRTLWFRYTNTTAAMRNIRVRTCGSSFSNYLAAFSICEGDYVASNSGGGCTAGQLGSTIRLCLQPNESALIAVGSINSNEFGAGTLNITSNLPATNDTCDNATPLIEGNNTCNTTLGCGVADVPCRSDNTESITYTREVWYKFTAPYNGTASLSINANTGPVAMTVREGCNGAIIKCADGDRRQDICISMVAGTEYLVAISQGLNDSAIDVLDFGTGQLSLGLSDQLFSPPDDALPEPELCEAARLDGDCIAGIALAEIAPGMSYVGTTAVFDPIAVYNDVYDGYYFDLAEPGYVRFVGQTQYRGFVFVIDNGAEGECLDNWASDAAFNDGCLNSFDTGEVFLPIAGRHEVRLQADDTPANWRLCSDEDVHYWIQRVCVACGPTCNDIDFNNDGSLFDPQDIDALLSVYSEGPCIPDTASCDDIDFNNDTSLFDPCDIDSFLLVFSEGPCTLCGQ